MQAFSAVPLHYESTPGSLWLRPVILVTGAIHRYFCKASGLNKPGGGAGEGPQIHMVCMVS